MRDLEDTFTATGETHPAVRMVTGPAHLASALINGDESGLDMEGYIELEAFKGVAGSVQFVDVFPHSERFTWHYFVFAGLPNGPHGGMVVDYKVLPNET